MLYDQISSNKRRSIILVALYFVLIVSLGFVFGKIFATPLTGMIFAFAFCIIMSLFSFFAGDSMLLAISGARQVTKQENPYLVHTVEGLAIAAGLPTPKVFMIDDTAINAFATGRDPQHASITVTRGTAEKLDRAELEGVIGHEMSHIKNFDIRLMMLVAVLVGAVAILSDFMIRSFLWGRKRNDRENSSAVFIIIGLALAVLAPIIAQLIKFTISRRREFLADADGALLTRNPQGLADALKKIGKDKEVLEAANAATAPLYISNPLKNSADFISKLFSTHPPLAERIKALEAM